MVKERARRIEAEQSGGHIAVESQPGDTAPLKIYPPRAFESFDAPPRKIPDPNPLACEKTILLVEDEAMLRELAATILEDLGYKVFTAENGRAALDLLRGGDPPQVDLVLTDLIMPEMCGQELVRQLRPLSPHTKIIYSSGYTEDSIIGSGGPEAGIHFLPKPYTVTSLSEKVREVLGDGAAPAHDALLLPE